ncbi:carbohydrate ABC transporter permease [Gordonia zhaorongruii]|uniref:carbohydrate ABC transporter permease n=1 Tax=Gordonia zhaorongruii TaxID=2597659 RepID=UPI00104BD3D5|nr:ABC transporter permease subunit [Gordonia zhaorongruii]
MTDEPKNPDGTEASGGTGRPDGTPPGGLTPHAPGPDTRPGRHAMPDERVPEKAVEQTGPIPTVHSDVWVAPAGRPARAETPQEPARPAAQSASSTESGSSRAPAAGVLEAEPAGSKPRSRGATAKGTARRSSERRLALLLAGPAALVMLIVTGYPIIYSIWLSLTDSNLREPGEERFVGLSNYGTVLGSGYWWTALWVTLYITVISVIIEFILGMAIAMVMHRALFGRGLVRTVVLLPYGIVTAAAAISWKYAWTPGTGYLANLLPDGSTPLTEQMSALSIVILAEVWKTTPFMALLLLAGLALVPDDLLKAAQVDGAGPWTRLFKIILPLMKPAILVALLFRTLDAFRVFDNIYVLTSGNHQTGSVSMLGYNNLFKAFNLGIGSAISVLIFLCVALIAIVFIKGFGASAPGSDDEGR